MAYYKEFVVCNCLRSTPKDSTRIIDIDCHDCNAALQLTPEEYRRTLLGAHPLCPKCGAAAIENRNRTTLKALGAAAAADH